MLANYCYQGMFQNCTSLMTATELPATSLANYCYANMFQNCTSLTTAPELPATELGQYCYNYMFNGCSSLTSAPELPATTLLTYCYANMFQNCTSLTTAPTLPATTLAINCYQSMFQGCTSLTTAPELPATTLAINCYYSMFQGCTSLMTAPELPATTLVSRCYQQMFYDCASLNYIKALFTTTPSSSYTNNWVYDVAPTGTFVKADADTWDVTGTNGVPNGWTVFTESTEPKFSVSSTKKVKFAKGNLQATYNGSSWTWKFAEHQWDYVGNAAANTSINGVGTVSSNGTVDLFGWVGASSTWTGVAMYGISNSVSPVGTKESLKADWGSIPGVVSAYGDGWFTLSSTEWNYVLIDRTSGATVNGTPNARYTEATINTDGSGVNGVILFPDGVTIAGPEVTSWGAINNGSDWATKCTTAQWSALESKGCVFLPAAGSRYGSKVNNVGSYGFYWSSTPSSSYVGQAYLVRFYSGSMNPQFYNSSYLGFSVRLAREID